MTISSENDHRLPDSSLRAAAEGYAVAVEVISACVAAVGMPLLGLWLDGYFGVLPCLLVSGLILGLASGSLSLWRVGQRLSKK